MEPTLAEKKIGIFFNLKLFLILVTENLNSDPEIPLFLIELEGYFCTREKHIIGDFEGFFEVVKTFDPKLS
jgi:hypothetical protein